MKSTNVVALCLASLLCACSAMTTISSPQEGATLVLRDRTLLLPATEKVKGTSFGNYEFKATEKNDGTGSEPFYGILPLRMNGGHMAADIILFAPGMFFNLRSAFPFYEVDARNHVIRYKNNKADAWVEYKSTPEEEARARAFFAGQGMPAVSNGGTVTH